MRSVDALREGMTPFTSETWLDGAIRRYLILPVVLFGIWTLMLLPIYVPIGAGYVYVLRAIDRVTAAQAGAHATPTTEAPGTTPTTGASGISPLDVRERTLASAVRESSAVVVAKVESPFIVQGEKAVSKGPPYRWNVLRFRIVEGRGLREDAEWAHRGMVLRVSAEL